ncbi:hypothetical protein Pan97_45820 [Bremerella volcania]|uniref:Uncharacterized protein n=1 Tax=Bremerella volcania TaxID=2527984 RepID=A0A518CE68_9BACT|nr:hypothetical protein Pan97_45820 [Bremerella volcania]
MERLAHFHKPKEKTHLAKTAKVGLSGGGGN